jgi:hypothetical protein
MRLASLFLALVSLLNVATAQRLDDGESYPLEKGEASDPLYGNRPARTMSQREYSQFYEREVLRPTIEQGILTGALAFNLQSGEVYFCKTAPEPSSLTLLLLGGLVFPLGQWKRESRRMQPKSL